HICAAHVTRPSRKGITSPSVSEISAHLRVDRCTEFSVESRRKKSAEKSATRDDHHGTGGRLYPLTDRKRPFRLPLHLGRALLSSAMSAYSSMRWRMPLIPDVSCSICRSEPSSRWPT